MPRQRKSDLARVPTPAEQSRSVKLNQGSNTMLHGVQGTDTRFKISELLLVIKSVEHSLSLLTREHSSRRFSSGSSKYKIIGTLMQKDTHAR